MSCFCLQQNKAKHLIKASDATLDTLLYYPSVAPEAADSLGQFNPGPAFPKHTKGTIHLCFQMLSLVRAKPDLLCTVRFIYMLLLTITLLRENRFLKDHSPLLLHILTVITKQQPVGWHQHNRAKLFISWRRHLRLTSKQSRHPYMFK